MRKINYKERFRLSITFEDCQGEPIPAEALTDMVLNFHTGFSPEVYTASRKGDMLSNCVLPGDGSLVATFGEHNLPPGVLRCELTVNAVSDRYSPWMHRKIIPVYIGVKLVVSAPQCRCPDSASATVTIPAIAVPELSALKALGERTTLLEGRTESLEKETAILPPLSRIVAVLHYDRVAGDEAATRSNRLVAVGHLVEDHPEFLSNMDTRLIDGPMASRDTLDPYREPQMLCFTNIYGYGEESVPGRPGWWFRSIGFLPDMPYRIDCTLIYGYSGSGGYWDTQTIEPGIYKWPSDSWKVPNPFHLPAFRMCNDHEIDLVFQSADYRREYGALYVVPDIGGLQRVYKNLKNSLDYLSGQQNTFSRQMTEAKDGIKALILRVERLETESRLLGYGLSHGDARRLLALGLPAAQYDLVPRYMEIGYDMDDIERCLPVEIPDPDAAFAYAREVMEGWVPGTKLRDDQNLVVAPRLDTSGIKDMSRMFANCNNLRVVPWFDTSQATSLASLFDQCHSLETVPDIDTGAATDMNAMFWNCHSLAHPPRTLVTSGANVRAMFASCEEMTDLPEIDASGTTNISLLCTRCFNLEELSVTNMQNVTKALQMLYHCEKLRRISPLDTPALADMGNMFDGCKVLEAIPLVDMRSATKVGIAFYGLFAATLINAVNLGTQPQQTLIEFHDCQNWGYGDAPGNRQSLTDTLITNSHDRASASMEPCRIRLHNNTRALLTPEEIAAITAKGYTITT